MFTLEVVPPPVGGINRSRGGCSSVTSLRQWSASSIRAFRARDPCERDRSSDSKLPCALDLKSSGTNEVDLTGSAVYSQAVTVGSSPISTLRVPPSACGKGDGYFH